MRVVFLVFIFFGVLFGGEFLVVSGKGSSSASPNSAMVLLQLSTEGETLIKAKERNDALLESVFEILESKNIEKKSLEIQNFSTFTQDEYDRNGVVTGKKHMANRAVRINFKTLENHNEIFSELLNLGVTYADVFYTNQNLLEFESKALDMALDEAKKKAEILAKSAGKTLEEIVLIEEIQDAYFPPFGAKFAQNSSDNSGVITIDRALKVKFRLK